MGGVSSRIFNKEDEGECGFCVFMKGGPCRYPFIEWDQCIQDAEASKEDVVDKCSEVTETLYKCMEAHPEYYESVSRARKAAEEIAEKETEKENVAKEAEKNAAVEMSDSAKKNMDDEKAVKEVGSSAAVEVAVKAEKEMEDQKEVKEVGSSAAGEVAVKADKEMEKETALPKNQN